MEVLKMSYLPAVTPRVYLEAQCEKYKLRLVPVRSEDNAWVVIQTLKDGEPVVPGDVIRGRDGIEQKAVAVILDPKVGDAMMIARIDNAIKMLLEMRK